MSNSITFLGRKLNLKIKPVLNSWLCYISRIHYCKRYLTVFLSIRIFKGILSCNIIKYVFYNITIPIFTVGEGIALDSARSVLGIYMRNLSVFKYIHNKYEQHTRAIHKQNTHTKQEYTIRIHNTYTQYDCTYDVCSKTNVLT